MSIDPQALHCLKKLMVSFQEKVNVLSQRTPFSIYKKLSENFTRCLLELDSIDVKNQTRVRF